MLAGGIFCRPTPAERSLDTEVRSPTSAFLLWNPNLARIHRLAPSSAGFCTPAARLGTAISKYATSSKKEITMKISPDVSDDLNTFVGGHDPPKPGVLFDAATGEAAADSDTT